MKTVPHPWRDARADAALVIEWSEHMPAGVLAATRGDTVWMNTRQGQAERRCSLMHELIHRERGETCGAEGVDEERVRQLTARRLLPLDLLADGLCWTTDPFELAEHCWVDVDTITVRLSHLHPAERHHLRRATAHHREGEQA